MGLDQRLVWIGKPSQDMVDRLESVNIIENGTMGMDYICENDIDEPYYKSIIPYTIKQKVKVTVTDWDMIKSECNESKDRVLIGIHNDCIDYADNYKGDNIKTHDINVYLDKYDKVVDETIYLYMRDRIYHWRNNYELHDAIKEMAGELENCCYVPVTEELAKKIREIDSNAMNNISNLKNVFYNADW